jgi:hypothetical protein
MYRAAQQFNELKERPDIDQASSRYEEMYTRCPAAVHGCVPVPTVAANPGGAACGPEFAALAPGSRQDAVIRGLANSMVPGNLPGAQWDRAVSIVDTVVRSYGFNSGPIVVISRPSDHEVDFYDSYQAELIFGTAVNTAMTFTTGSAWWCGAPTEGMGTDQKLTKLAVPVSGVTVYSSV